MSVIKSKVGTWFFLLAGTLWLLVGLRDTFAPGFFSTRGRVVTGNHIAFDVALAAIFLALAGSMATLNRRRK